MALFIYDRANYAQLKQSFADIRTHGRDLVLAPIAPESTRSAVRIMMRHDLIVVPTQVEFLTPMVQRMQQMAHLCNIKVIPLAAYLAERRNYFLRKARNKSNQPAAAAAVPPTQQCAAAGKPINPPVPCV